MRNASRHVSLDTPLVEGEETNRYAVIESEESPKPDEQLGLESLQTEIERTLKTLSERESEVLRLFYGLSGRQQMTLEEISKNLTLQESASDKLKKKQ